MPADQPAPVDDNFLPMPPRQNGQTAVRAEYDAALAQDTVAAWELFLARHPDNPLAADARLRLAAARGQ